MRFSIAASAPSSSLSYALSGPSTTNSTRSAFLAAAAASLARVSPRTSAKPGVSTSTTRSPAGQGISLRVAVVPPTTLVRNTGRPASALSSDDLPLEIVPKATISSCCASRLASSSATDAAISARISGDTRSPLRTRDRPPGFRSVPAPAAPADISLGLKFRRSRSADFCRVFCQICSKIEMSRPAEQQPRRRRQSPGRCNRPTG